MSLDFMKKSLITIRNVEDRMKKPFCVLADLRDTDPTWHASELQGYLDFYFSVMGGNEQKRVALLTKTPKQTAYSMIYESQGRTKKNFPIKIFNTVVGALNWLGKTGPCVEALVRQLEDFIEESKPRTK